MEKVVIEATHRNLVGKKVGTLRRAGKLPGVMYGYKIDPTPITMDLRGISRILVGLSQSHIVYLNVAGKEHAALVREKQRDFIRGTLKHIDFQVVSLTEKIRTKVSIEVTGVSPAIRNFNGVVVTDTSEVEVESLPQDLPESFVVDVSSLLNIGDAIYVKNLAIPANVELFSNPEELIVVITSGAQEGVEDGAEGEISEPEVMERGKKEDPGKQD